MAAQYAFVMKGMTKSFPGAQKPVLSNINLQFYQGAKIGIVGPNGAGKSTLMKIMAGIDSDFSGEAWAGENITVGYLAQEPELDPTKTVLENVKDGARATADLVEEFNAVSAQMAEPVRREAQQGPQAPRTRAPRECSPSVRWRHPTNQSAERVPGGGGAAPRS